MKISKPFLCGSHLKLTPRERLRRSLLVSTCVSRREKGKEILTPSTNRGFGSNSTKERLDKETLQTITGLGEGDIDDIQFLSSESESESEAFDENGSHELLVERWSSVTFKEIAESFPFELDKFQSIAIQELLKGKSVVVCAPTGAGKTAIADAAAAACLSRGKKVIYTTPLKALSNQKLYEFRQRFGEERVGLVTGDINIEVQAPIIVMTTEILRNMFYETEDQAPWDRRLDEIGLVVLDEVHYLADPGRGSVWEELIVGCPKEIQMLCMSATVANPQDLGDWISQIHGPCSTVRTSKRPVPLSWFFAFTKRSNATAIVPLLNADRTGVNPECVLQNKTETRNMTLFVPVLHKLILKMEREAFLPAIFFIFSRSECDRSAINMAALGITLTTSSERKAIQKAIETMKKEQPESLKKECEQALLSGIASHHAGCLPAWKHLVEVLFQSGLLKVVFATGTLAAGINMPARTTVITSLARKIDGNVTLLGHNELLQMAGRAGRRGFDSEGSCIILQSRFEGAEEAVTILRKGTEPLTSHFTTGYSFVLNLLAKFTLDEARTFLEKSFQSYLTGMGLFKRMEQIAELKQTARRLRKEAKQFSTDSSDAETIFYETRERLEEANRELKDALIKAKRERTKIIRETFRNQSFPFCVLIDTSKNALGITNLVPAFALGMRPARDDEGNAKDCLLCLGSDNVFYNASFGAVVGWIPESVDTFEALEDATRRVMSSRLRWSPTSSSEVQISEGNKFTVKAAFRIPSINKFERIAWSPATNLMVKAKNAKTRELKKELRNLEKPLKEEASDSGKQSVGRRLRSAEKRLKSAMQFKKELESQKDRGWNGFQATMDTLIQVGALENESLKILPLGHVTRELFGDNELWMAMVFTHERVQLLKPSLLAALASTFMAPAICTRPSLSFQIPPPAELEELLNELDGERSRLYELEVITGVVNPQSLMGLQMDHRAAGLVEAWASGCSWVQLVVATNLDDGDIARLLSRTIDILRQIRLSNYLLEPIKASAAKAHRDMDREPINYLM